MSAYGGKEWQDDARREVGVGVPVARDPAEQASCAHMLGIEHVEITQAGGSKYEWWRCSTCHAEFRCTGELHLSDGRPRPEKAR